MEPVLELKDLRTEFDTRNGTITAVDEVSYSVGKGETLGVVGESGCGKSVTSLSILRLIPTPPGRIAGGSILYGGEDLTQVSEQRIREIRGHKI
jgi:ABC-type dipeptide/oligopeptide/nickel transport system ATPase component